MRKSKETNKPLNKKLKDFSDSIAANAAHLPPMARSDLAWFAKNTRCRYYLRDTFPGEYNPEEISGAHHWYTLVNLRIDQNPLMYTSSDGGKTGRSAHMVQVGHIPITFSPADSDFIASLFADQTTKKNQTILSLLWADGLEKMGVQDKWGVEQ
ncbi:hypothetical protein Xbed_03179 [Xenorhabdus beddingii]|uniref:Uncharacterized protein n=1 Tax=Xenorhabdus beddingii TaxID=40578 RepID=A0A1Y2SJW3_9GAMM|nr:hypothetical protein [Xenorhabdus beddingii]OTA18180.1 hypothetical protein Xbed_03179 [Xenorhabdus beddingii]